jgi:hypothetical protein
MFGHFPHREGWRTKMGVQHVMQLQEPHDHHGSIDHHGVLSQERPHGPKHFGDSDVAARHCFVKNEFGLVHPAPCILECLNPGL